MSANDDPSSRDGPVRVLQGGKWKRKNGPVACDLCRKRRVRCSGFDTGAPCDSCRHRKVACVVGDDTYAHDAPAQTALFVPILPPPNPPCATPALPGTQHAPVLNLQLLCAALEASERNPRPAPLVWKAAPDDSPLQRSGATTRSREPRPAVSLNKPSGSGAPPRRRPLYRLDAPDSSAYSDEEEAERAPPPVKRRRVAMQAPPLTAEVFEAAVALYSLRAGALVSLEAWRKSSMVERGWPVAADAESPAAVFPLSTARDLPLPAPSQLAATPHLYTAPELYKLDFAYPFAFAPGCGGSSSSGQSRRGSLGSTSSNGSTSTTATSFFGSESGLEVKMRQ
ncbi:hypothetical protein JCM10207_001124 [Rhodosporidiobolus poonsookiae]